MVFIGTVSLTEAVTCGVERHDGQLVVILVYKLGGKVSNCCG